MTVTEFQNGREADPRALLERYLEEGEICFPPFFRRIKPSLYGPVLKYRDFFPEGSVPDRSEAAREGLSDLFAALCRRRAANRYEAAKDCVYELWALLQEKRILEKFYREGRDGPGILRGLRAFSSNHIYSLVTKKEPEMSRLFKRLKRLLEREREFALFESGDGDWWGLAGWRSPKRFFGSPEELRGLLSGIPAVFRIRERPGALKASVVIGNRDLKGLAITIYEALLQTLTASRLIRAVGLKLPIIDPGFIPLDAPAGGREEDGEGETPPGAAKKKIAAVQGWEMAAAEFRRSLTTRRRRVLRLYWLEENTLEETGAALGISKSLVKQEKDEIFRLLLRSGRWNNQEDWECFVAALRTAALENSSD